MTLHSRFIAGLAAAILSIAIPAHATTLFDSGLNSQTPPQAGSHVGAPAVDAQLFSLSTDAVLSSMTFGLWLSAPWNGTIDYYLFTSNGFFPSSAPFAQGTVSSYIETPVYSNSVVDVSFDLSTPVVLDANTNYWIGLSVSPDVFGWNSVVPFSGLLALSRSGSFNDWTLGAAEGAFALYGTPLPTPEPDSAWMMLCGFGLLSVALWHRRTRA